MRSYVPNTPAERQAMLRELCLGSMEDLFRDIPEELRLKRPLQLEAGKSELEVRRIFEAYRKNTDGALPLFRGAGAYRHYIPAAVPQLAMQSAFYTAYTPYQAEMSQGTLQAIFEYQTFVCELTGMDASNASVYDGATAAAESMLMLRDAKRKNKILYSAALLPDVKCVMKTYARFSGLTLEEIPCGADGRTDLNALASKSGDAAGFIAAQPNYYGCVEDLEAICDAVHGFGGLMVAYVNPMAMAVLKRPGDCGADIVVGEGQPLGLPLNLGGPYLGMMAAKGKYIRNLPGRIVGQTADAEGNRAFVLTLQAREQHIRREKASSNICSNQGLCALMASMYLALMGPAGLKEAAEQCLQKAHYLAEGISKIKGMRLRYPNTPFFHEFVVESDKDPLAIDAALKQKGFVGGLPLGDQDKGTLYCATEMNTREEIDGLLNALEVIA